MRQIPPKTAFFDIGGTLGDVIVSEPDGSVLRLEVYSGVQETLEELKANRVRIGVISHIGTHPPARVDRMLEEAALFDFLMPAPGSVDLRVYLPGTVRKDEAAFRQALRQAGHAATPRECVFVGESATERQEAAKVGMRVTDRPRLALDVLLGLQPSYLKVVVPSAHREAAWQQVLLEHLLLPLYVTGPGGSTVYAIGTGEAAAALRDYPLQFEVRCLGDPGDPLTHDVYLLRDVVAPPGEPLAAALASDEERSAVLDETHEGLIVMLPPDKAIEDYHPAQEAFHGHTQLLLPSTAWLRPVGVGPNAVTPAWLATIAPAALVAPSLTAQEVAILHEEIREPVLHAHITTYSEGITDSRHILHPKSASAVARMLEDLQQTLGAAAVSRHCFRHRARETETAPVRTLSLANVIAELPGRGAAGGNAPEGVILVGAHLDSTATGEDRHRPQSYQPRTEPAPGADDDGSGIAAVLAAARALKRLSDETGLPHRAIRFGLFNAEEQGRLGSIHYASDQRLAGAPILAVYCMDMIGFNGMPERDFEVHFGLASNHEVQERSRPLAELLEQVRPLVSPALAPVEVHPETPDTADGADHRSDHSSFQDAGFAACLVSENFFPTSGQPVTDSNPNYHRFGDRLDQLDLVYAADIARTVTAAVWLSARV